MKEGWVKTTLGLVCHIQSGSGFPENMQGMQGEKYPFYKVSDMNLPGNERLMSTANHSISEAVRKKLRANVFPAGTIIFPKVGGAISTNKKRKTSVDCCVDNNVMGLVPNEGVLNSDYLYYMMQEINIYEFSNKANPPSIRQTTVDAWPIVLPKSILEQKRIVSILGEVFDGIDAAVANTENNLASARALFDSHLSSVFTQKGKGWTDKKFIDLCENLDSRRVPITKSDRLKGDIPYYGASGIVDYVSAHLFDEDILLISEDGANLLARTYPIAFSVSGKSWVNNHAHVVRFKRFETQKIVEFYLNSISLAPYVSGMAQPKLNQKSLNAISIPVPSEKDQKRVVELIERLRADVERLEENYKEKIARLTELKSAILQKAFTGRLTTQLADAVQDAAE